MPGFTKNIAIWIVVVVLLVALFNIFQGGMDQTGGNRLAFSEFLSHVDAGEISDVTIKETPARGSLISGHYSDGSLFITQAPDYPGLVDRLSHKNVKISVVADDGRGFPFTGHVSHQDMLAGNLGPVTLRERATALGGTISIDSTNVGARVELMIPIAAAEKSA